MPTAVQTVLRRRFGLRALRPVQSRIIDRVMSGGHALVVMPTGSGKSLCYQLPAVALEQPGVTLVFSPLIALMEDQIAALKERGIEAEYINSTLSRRERDRRMARLAKGAYEIIYATPERMQKPAFVEAIDAVPGGVKLLAVDEAHCISRWGHDLRPAYREIGRFRKQLGSPTTIALTATATRGVRNDVRRTLGIRPEKMPLFATPVDRPNLSLEAIEVWHEDDKIRYVREILKPRGRSRGTAIIYFARIKDLEHMESRLRRRLDDRPTAIYHGQLPPGTKKKIYDRFIDATPDEGLALFATNAFGLGVDKPDVRFVIHAQMPGSVEAYHQEVGRAGRDGKRSRCVLLYAPDDVAIQQMFAEWSNPSPDLLVRAARAVEECPHADFDMDELQVLVSGRARTDARGLLEHTLIALEKRGIVEPTSIMGRYRFVRPLEHGEVDAAAMERKRQRDLRRLLDVVKLAKCRDLSAYVSRYFDLGDETAGGGRRRGRRGRRGGRRGATTRRPVTKKAPATKKATVTKKATAGKKKRRRRRRGRRPSGEE